MTTPSISQTGTPKKKPIGLIIAIIIGGLFVICLGCIAFSVIGQAVGIIPTANPTKQEQDVSAVQTSVYQTVVAGIATKTPAPNQQPTDLPASTDIPPTSAPVVSMGNVGERIEHSGIALTIVNVSKVSSINNFMNAQEGYIYLVVEVIIENATRSDETPYNPLYFSVKDADGFQYTSAMIAPDTALTSGKLVKGDKVRGNVAFEVKNAASGFIISYEPIVILGGYTPIRINLGQ